MRHVRSISFRGLLLCLAFLLLLSSFSFMLHLDHDCEGAHCEICALIFSLTGFSRLSLFCAFLLIGYVAVASTAFRSDENEAGTINKSPVKMSVRFTE